MSGPAYDLRAWERRLIEGLMALLVFAFAAWAGVVYEATQDVVRRFDTLTAAQAEERIQRAQYLAVLERRLTIMEQRLDNLEQRQRWLIDIARAEHGNRVP